VNGRGIDWRRCGVQALLFSAMQAAVVNTGYFVFLSQQGVALLGFEVAVVLAAWFGFGLLMAACAQAVEGRWTPPAIAALGAGLCALSMAQHDLNAALRSALGAPPVAIDVSRLWIAWLAVFVGAPFFWYCVIVQRSVRVRAVLARAEHERARSAALVGQARADALEGRVDPALLQRALTAVQATYGHDRSHAEAQLDALVDFLRQAMPAVRSGRSTLVGELTLLRRFAALTRLIDGGRELCSVSIEAPPRDPAFGPLLLVPLVEALSASRPADAAPPHVGLTVDGPDLKLTFDAQAPGRWLDDTLAQRLQRALHALPDTARARVDIGGTRALTVWLPLPPCEEREHEDERMQFA
jgi:hypothetical protein